MECNQDRVSASKQARCEEKKSSLRNKWYRNKQLETICNICFVYDVNVGRNIMFTWFFSSVKIRDFCSLDVFVFVPCVCCVFFSLIVFNIYIFFLSAFFFISVHSHWSCRAHCSKEHWTSTPRDETTSKPRNGNTTCRTESRAMLKVLTIYFYI